MWWKKMDWIRIKKLKLTWKGKKDTQANQIITSGEIYNALFKGDISIKKSPCHGQENHLHK